jgi:hypothetical protein
VTGWVAVSSSMRALPASPASPVLPALVTFAGSSSDVDSGHAPVAHLSGAPTSGHYAFRLGAK